VPEDKIVTLTRLHLVLTYLVRQVASEGQPIWIATIPPSVEYFKVLEGRQ
jgi:hypothetical protein